MFKTSSLSSSAYHHHQRHHCSHHHHYHHQRHHCRHHHPHRPHDPPLNVTIVIINIIIIDCNADSSKTLSYLKASQFA